ncbi:hypothetical protein K6W76_33850, partial [Burkholderia anthina]|uniref:hypothetical protein n=2 Tax=Burkholderia TaxID=32008 RepID=UPI001ABBD9C0
LRRPGSTAEPGVTQQNCRAVERIHVICESGLNPVDGYFNGLLCLLIDSLDQLKAEPIRHQCRPCLCGLLAQVDANRGEK